MFLPPPPVRLSEDRYSYITSRERKQRTKSKYYTNTQSPLGKPICTLWYSRRFCTGPHLVRPKFGHPALGSFNPTR